VHLNEAQQYAVIAGAMTINHDGKELTLQQAANLLKEQDRNLRQTAYDKISGRRLADKAALDQLFSNLITKRHKVAKNASFTNYRDYMFAAMARFDYTADDCFNFHSAIHELIVPICEDFDEERRVALHLDALKPWDRDVDVSGKEAPKPFDNVDELVEKTIVCFQQIHPFLGQCMEVLKAMKHVDLDSRIGKAPGGYNYPLYETNVPFIFMNATHSLL
jgi:oligoendopeptidase F